MNLWIIFTLILSSFVTVQHGLPLMKKNLKEILELIKSQKHPDVGRRTFDSTSSDSTSQEDSPNNSLNGVMRSMDVIDLIQKAERDKNIQKDYEEFETHVKSPVFRNYEIDRNKISDTKHVLEKLLHNIQVDKANPSPKKHKRLTPNNLLGPITLDDDRGLQTNELNDYSKIFVVLDPLAVRESKNKDALTKLVSKILSMSSSSKKARQERNERHRYKGFRVKNNLLSRRYRREFNEGGSAEDDYKPKRLRNDHSGGGAGGRTAIPYIRQRGDIYEREH